MKKLFLDIVPVLVGILLALFVNNWRQLVSEQNYIEQSVASILKENEGNIKELKHALSRQATFRDSIRFYIDDDRMNLVDVMRKTNGVYTPDLKSTTWKFLVQDSKHTLVPYEFINRLAEIEKYEKLVNQFNEKVRDIIFQPAFFDDPRLKKVGNILFSDFGAAELAMIKEMEDFSKYARDTFTIPE